ncbi:urease accessory protein UreE [Psychrobacter sp. N25K4-3-2]|uniref:Urease accessory protein UreE n=1 Tax=Psychrobacter glaciei TaxID=619771 RepID=A0ABQ3GPV0_9GAMM|nr:MULTISPECIES: urease accessory protein UreE [Psychrobacter]MBF4490717.1 urease accessory protein UreE [Psychrobacter sp. N25K4-3-2]GHD29145.1 urease accessory protein UreE [Psychrobacter glaciei]
MNIYTQRLDPSTLNSEQQAIIDRQKQAENFLYLDFDTRQRSRFKAETQHQESIGVDLPRTETIKNGSVLADYQGNLIQIMAAKQALIEVTADNDFDLMKGAYHLGNRHVPLMLTPTALYFEPDHVLEAMLHQLGLHTQTVQAPFEPETGAYKGNQGGLSHSHGHNHSHHNQNHDHSHTHGNSHD